jgi:invasion protein IalB
MKQLIKLAVVMGALAIAAAPAMAGQSQTGQEHGNGPTYQPAPETPGPQAPLPEKAKAYGVYCQGESKKHVDGQKGTPFSQCVTAMAKAAHNERLTARQACKGTSKKHVKGEKGTPFSRCVTAAAKLRKALSG